MRQVTETVVFDDNDVLSILYGPQNNNLDHLAGLLALDIVSRGNSVLLSGPDRACDQAARVLKSLYEQLRTGRLEKVADAETEAAVRLASGPAAITDPGGEETLIKTRKHPVRPRSLRQARYIRAIRTNPLVFGMGPAGTGKTFLAVALAVEALLTGQVDRIILSRPAVEAGERLGFLPGDLKDKVDPYLRPLYDALHACLPAEQVARRLENNEIEIAPLAFMRGRTLSHAFVILDEAQNTTPMQMKMFLTRLGEGSRMVVTGDLSQVDLPKGQISGLRDAVSVLGRDPQVGQIRFQADDVVRHALVARIVLAYEAQNRNAGAD